MSCVFWTITLQTTFKYVILALNADNKGEGGIFSLFALLRRKKKFLVWFAVLGASALLADGMITPPISVTAAVEGLNILFPELPIIPIVLGILTILFLIQRFGTNFMGFAFGPAMLVWFTLLAVLGLTQIFQFPSIFKAVNPYYAYKFLIEYPGAFWLLGAVFLCATGAEALYSDLGHCGKKNIRITWGFVKAALLLNYFGQGAWLLQRDYLHGKNPFFAIMPEWFLLTGITIATLAAIIASQALISGSFTLVSEAIRMDIWPKYRILFPTSMKGQVYVPLVNWLLLAGCVFVVLYFKRSENMEAVYGLSISLTMLMTTILLAFYLRTVKKQRLLPVLLIIFIFLVVESAFFTANLAKFAHGGSVALIIAGVLFLIMFVWYKAQRIKNHLTELTPLPPYFNAFRALSEDKEVPKFSTHLVFLTNSADAGLIESKILYSIFQKSPKRADYYWFLHVNVTDEPYTLKYKVKTLVPNDIVRIDFYLGFRIEPRINLFFRKVVENLLETKEINISTKYTSIKKMPGIGDFRFVVLQKHLSFESDLPASEQLVMDLYFGLKKLSLSEISAFGLDTSSVLVEKVPLVLSPIRNVRIERMED